MRIRTRNLLALVVVIVIVVALGLAIYLRRRAAPEPARLLPESDAVVYVNFKLIRRLTNFGDKPVQPHEPEYERFVQETGFQFERDLDEVAFAVHAAKPGSVPDTRYSEVFEGHFDGQRAAAYLRKIAASTEKYRDVEIFNIPVENRVVRVAILGVDTSAASNTEGPVVIHGIIDRYKQLALPFSGPPLIRDYYKKVPFASLVWTMAAVPQAPDDPRLARPLTLPGGFDIYVPPQSVLVGSARTFTGSVNVKAELFTKGEDDARKFAEQTGTFLTIFKGIESSMQPSGSDPDVKAVFESLKVEQEHDRAIITATLPLGFFKKMLAEPPVELGAPKAEEPAVPTAPEKKAAPARKKRAK
jgi:hypothetical protein